MLYIATTEPLPLSESPDLRVEAVNDTRRVVERWFSHAAVRFVGAHTGCSCGFPSVFGESRIEYYDGMPLESDDRDADLRSVRALIALISLAARSSDRVELYPVADGDEGKPPRGVIEWQLPSLQPERLFFNEQFMHVVHTRADPVASDRVSRER